MAAVHELTPLKGVCLAKCRSPLLFLLGSWREGMRGALRMGAVHGAWCVGCCWALMAAAPDAIPGLAVPGGDGAMQMMS